MKVLIIEDDPEIVESVSLVFQIRWPEADLISAHLGEKGVDLSETEAPDIIILDIGLPDINGFEVLKRIRLFSDVPIIILTVLSEESDIVKGLELGADDYVTKPFKQMELMARIKVLIRRQQPLDQEAPVVCGSLRFDPLTRQLHYGDKQMTLTKTESNIFSHLIRNIGNVATHASLAEAMWGENHPDADDALKVHIRRLREKLEDNPGRPQLIITKPGIGYLLARLEGS
ncbi:response regulator transcription factor [Chloroflexota bacterium]